MRKRILLVIPLFLIIAFSANAQSGKLKAGFDKNEYLEVLRTAAHVMDTPWISMKVPAPEKYRLEYRSPEMGLKNRWDLWISTDSIAMINVRGTAPESVSWLANFYAAMVPAQGQLKISNQFTFTYHLANNPKAAVHVGWLVALASLSSDILNKIDSCERAGITEFIVTGHSQGGAITYLLTSYLLNLKESGRFSERTVFKTYCSAGPKPGNLFYAQEFEAATMGGWAFNVVNAVDWVPEFPFSIQTVNDFNNVNPFNNIDKVLKKQKFPINLVLTHYYKRLSKPTIKAQKRFERTTGNTVYKQVKKVLPEFVEPVYFPSNNYMRAGTPIVMIPDSSYYTLYPDDEQQLFIHHLPPPYYYLAEKLKL